MAKPSDKNRKFSWIPGFFKSYKGPDRMSKNTAILMGVVVLVVLSIFGRLLYLMVLNKDEYQQAAVSQQLKVVNRPANRGTIYDANGEKLVQSAAAWVIYLYPKQIQEDQRDMLCRELADVLHLDYDAVAARSNLNSNSVKLTTKADKEQKDLLQAFIYRTCYVRDVQITDENGKKKTVEEVYLEDHPELELKKVENYQYIKGISLTVDSKRYYYHGSLASTVIGFANFDNVGSGGVEGYYNSELKGVDGKIIKAKNSKGGEMPFDYDTVIEPIDGNSLELTIDASIQAVLEKYLRQAYVDNNVENRAVGIIMNVKTGGILAMATMNDYDPANYLAIKDAAAQQKIDEIEDPKEKQNAINAAQQLQWRNKAISDAYEPGSVFKPITMSAALEEGLTSMSDTFTCPGYKLVGGRIIHCHKVSGHGTETLTQGMMNSCNPVLMTLGERLGAANFYKYFTAYGLTTSTGIDLPGEAPGGSYHKEEDLTKPQELATSSFGQTFTVTPIQMITAFAAAVNGGYLRQPYVVEKIIDPDGNIVKSHEPVVKRQVISETTSHNIDMMLEATAGVGGTAHNVYISGYRIGAKTGTSEKIATLATTGERKYVASMGAVVPVDDPEIAILILLDEPNNPRSHGGGTIVAPVVRNVLSEVLPHLGIDTIYSENDARLMDTMVPNVVGQSTEEATAALEAKGLNVRVIGEGSTVTGQIPSGSRSAPKSSTVVVTTESDGEVPMTTVPDLVGLSPTQVAWTVKNKNLNIRYSGTGYESSSGVSKSQDIPVGSRVEQGTVVTVEFSVTGITD
ncbi:MAG: PASTA domain-containing protein [Clostridia bacterium]|nr:PASTA domain-containing protein [Clostridia bacterium]